MGMYDAIIADHGCPRCAKHLKDYQTKALACLVNNYKLGDKPTGEGLEIIEGNFEIYDFCTDCEITIEGKAYVKNGIISKIVNIVEGIEHIVTELK
ncbi:MAG: hypothetical protein AABW88_00010 [Nanoarchaeota archaeon]